MNNICSPQRKNISIQTTSVFMMALLQLLSIIVLARVLTPLDFGKIAAASVIIALATMLSEIGIGSAIVQRKEISKRYISTAFNLSSIDNNGYGLMPAVKPLLATKTGSILKYGLYSPKGTKFNLS